MSSFNSLYLSSIHLGFVFIAINGINEINKGILYKNNTVIMANSVILILSSIMLVKTTRLMM